MYLYFTYISVESGILIHPANFLKARDQDMLAKPFLPSRSLSVAGQPKNKSPLNVKITIIVIFTPHLQAAHSCSVAQIKHAPVPRRPGTEIEPRWCALIVPPSRLDCCMQEHVWDQP